MVPGPGGKLGGHTEEETHASLLPGALESTLLMASWAVASNYPRSRNSQNFKSPKQASRFPFHKALYLLFHPFPCDQHQHSLKQTLRNDSDVLSTPSPHSSSSLAYGTKMVLYTQLLPPSTFHIVFCKYVLP